MGVCAFVSFRLRMHDGVSIVAGHWQQAMAELGFDSLTVAGEGPVDRTVAGLAIGAAEPPSRSEIEAALADADLVVVANLCTIPLNIAAATAVAEVLKGRPAVMHHHDPPWQRERFAGCTSLPIDDPAWRHVTINELTVAEMAERGFAARCVYSGMPTATGRGERAAMRSRLGVADDAVLLAHPVRAIPRKNVAGAIALAEALDAVYWLWGPHEEGYGEQLRSLLADASCQVVLGTRGAAAADLYGAADGVLFPSTWEGFGLPPVEAAIHRLPAAVGDYPVAHELAALGFRWFAGDDPGPLGRFLAAPDRGMLEHNRRLAVRHFSVDALRERLAALLADMGSC